MSSIMIKRKNRNKTLLLCPNSVWTPLQGEMITDWKTLHIACYILHITCYMLHVNMRCVWRRFLQQRIVRLRVYALILAAKQGGDSYSCTPAFFCPGHARTYYGDANSKNKNNAKLRVLFFWKISLSRCTYIHAHFVCIVHGWIYI